MTYTYSLDQGRFMIISSRKAFQPYHLLWEDMESKPLPLMRNVDGMVAFQAVITQETGLLTWDERSDETIPAEIYDFSLWAAHRSFSEDRSAMLQAC